MRNSRPKSLDVLFDDTHTLDKTLIYNVQQQALSLLKLNRIVKSLLPVPLQLWCRVANVRQDILVLEAANASWMMRLRYEKPMLLSTLRLQILPLLSSIDIRINPGLMVKEEDLIKNMRPTLPLRHISQKSAMVLRGLAYRSPTKLRKILEQLASLSEKNTNIIYHNK